MSFAAEPYGVFVDDLLTRLTGGVTREERVFSPHGSPYPLGEPEDAEIATVRVHGLVDGAFHRFVIGTDFEINEEGALIWLADGEGQPRARAVWPDRGSHFYVSYERRAGATGPSLLNDRNPGSVVRLLAESFAREHAVLSKQLEKVYRAGFLATAAGRDLEQIAALVGLERRRRGHAIGELVFSRGTPAPADIFLPAGLRVSSVEPPAITVETLEDRVLQAGSLSVSAPIQSLEAGPSGVAAAGALRVLHRPTHGISDVDNPQALRFGGADESDEALRRRARRALEGSGAATEGAMIAALQSLDGIREEDVSIITDHLAFPGTVKVTVAADLTAAQSRRAAELLRDTKPAGIRLIHNLDVQAPPELSPDSGSGDSGSGEPAVDEPSPSSGFEFNIRIAITVTPADADATPERKARLQRAVEESTRAFVAARGVGEPLIYNRLVADLMALEGVQDIALSMRAAAEDANTDSRGNLMPASDKKPALEKLEVILRGALVAFDVTVGVELLGLAAIGDLSSALADVRQDLQTRLPDIVSNLQGTLTPRALLDQLTATDRYQVEKLSYTVELVDEGLRVRRRDVSLEIDAEHSPWIRTIHVVEEAAGP